MKIAVIGAGPAGLCAAYRMAQQGAEVQVYEASKVVGGLCCSFKLWGQIVDLGPHRYFSFDRRVNHLWLELARTDYTMVPRLSRVLYRGKFFPYPLSAIQTFLKLGPVESIECFFSFLSEYVHPSPDRGDFESWIRRRFGKRLYEIFFKTYSEKLWGIRCDELEADFAAQRIKGLSLPSILKSSLLPRLSARLRTLADEFAYPNYGTGVIYERMAAAIQSYGGTVNLESPIREVVFEKNHISGIRLPDGTLRKCDHLISTMPLTNLVEQLAVGHEDVLRAARELDFRNTILTYLEIKGSNLFKDNWIYVHDPKLLCGRISNFRNWSPFACGDSPNSILALEFWCNNDDEIFEAGDDWLIERSIQELLASKLIKSRDEVINGMVRRVVKSYPIYRRGYKDRLKPIIEFLRQFPNLSVLGRYGAFKYNNQDHSLLMGILAAENIMSGSKHDLWAVNQDYEQYQEACRIDATGIVSELAA